MIYCLRLLYTCLVDQQWVNYVNAIDIIMGTSVLRENNMLTTCFFVWYDLLDIILLCLPSCMGLFLYKQHVIQNQIICFIKPFHTVNDDNI